MTPKFRGTAGAASLAPRSLMVLVEDCRTFEAHAYALVELRAMGFRGLRSVPRTAATGRLAAGSDHGLLERSGQAATP